MGHRYQELLFTDTVKALQETAGSRSSYARREAGDAFNHSLGSREIAFIARRDSFYLASVGETGWPYLQHRGGPPGFVRVLDERTLGFADLRGNRQYISVGNLLTDDRVSLFFMDYVNRARLKLLGRARLVPAEDRAMLEKLTVSGYDAKAEHGVLIKVEAFDWNCPQHITQRLTLAEIEEAVAPLRQRIAELEAMVGPDVRD